MSPLEYIRFNPNVTASEVAFAVGKETSSVHSILSGLCSKRILIRKQNHRKEWLYRVNDMPFGCNNELTMMFNQLLVKRRNSQGM